MGIKGMGKKTLMACVAAIVAALVLVYLFTTVWRDDEPKAKAESVGKQPPVQVYPEQGFEIIGLSNKGGKLSCSAVDGVPTTPVLLPDSGGTSSYNGTLLSADYTADSVAVAIEGSSRFVSGWVTAGDKGMVPFVVPDEATGKSGSGIRLEMQDFKAYLAGGIADITLCTMD